MDSMKGTNHLIANTSCAVVSGVIGLWSAKHIPDMAASVAGISKPVSDWIVSTSQSVGNWLTGDAWSPVNGFLNIVSGTEHWSFQAFLAIAIGFLLFVIGSYLPDIDHPNSTFGRHFHLPVGHRTWTHTIYPVIAFMLCGMAFRPFLWLAIGYFGHLFWDGLSRGGVCWFNPVSGYVEYPGGAKVKKRHPVKLYRVGEPSEYVIVTILVMSAVTSVLLYATVL